jgi:hypothetical protein
MTVTRYLSVGLRTAVLGNMATATPANAAPPLVISHVNVDTMAADGSVLRDRAVVIRDSRIESIATRAPRLPAARLINGADADPLTDVANMRRISAVIVGERYFSRADLDARMTDLTKRNTTHRAQGCGRKQDGCC